MYYAIGVSVSSLHRESVDSLISKCELVFLGARLSEVIAPESISLSTYHHCLAKILCNPPLPACHLGECACISKFRDAHF